MARSRRFERPTPTLGGWCSIHLSYERIYTFKIIAVFGLSLNKTLQMEIKRDNTRYYLIFLKMVGTEGFEPSTSWSRTKRTTKLCYVPSRPQLTIITVFNQS